MNLTSIKLTVTGAHAWAEVNGRLTSGMVGLPVTIEYDEAWEGLIKNLVCRCTPWDSDEGETRVVLNVENTATVAHEVMQAGMRLHLGVEGFREDGTLVIPTTWAICKELIQPGANSDGDPTADPSLPVWDQIQAQIEQINRDGITQERMDEIRDCAESAARAAGDAARSETSAAAAASIAVSSTNAAEAAAIQAKASEEHAKTSASSAANLANGALQAQKAAQAAAERAELAADCLLAPVSKTADMTQPVGVDEDGRLWTAPTAGNGGGEVADMLVGALPQTIPGAGYYLLSDTDATVTTDPGDGNAGPTNLLDGVEILSDLVSYADGIITQVAQTAWVRIADLTPLLEPGQLYTWAFESVNVQTTGGGFRVYAGDSPDVSGALIANCYVYWANENGSGWTDGINTKNGVSEAPMTWDGTSRYVSLMVGGAAGKSYKLALYKGSLSDESEPVLTLELAAGEKKAMDSYIGKTFYSDAAVRLYKTAEQTEEAPAVDQRPLAGKHGLFIGDSLTTTLTGADSETGGWIHAEKSYPEYFAEKTGCVAHIYAASGASALSYFENKYPEIDFSLDYDFAIIMLGTNAALGDVYGEAYASLVEKLAEDTGGKTQIFLVTPPYNNYATGSSAAWAKNANPVVHEMGQTYCLPVIDTYHDSGINQFNGALYRPIDDLHFNDAGYERLAGFIASQVLSKYWL